MKKIALRGNIVLPGGILSGGLVLIEGEKIAAVISGRENPSPQDFERIDYGSSFVCPGLIDLHLHGALGKDVLDGELESLKTIALHQARCGVTGFVPTTAAAPLETTFRACQTVKSAPKASLPSRILGLHLEGLFLNPGKKGAQDPEFIREVDAATISLIEESVSGIKTILTVAPEVGRNMDYMAELKEKGFILSIGHSDATYEQAVRSFGLGVTQATHLFNAMSGFHPREPGVIGAVLDSSSVMAEIIADGVHLHPAALRLAVRQKGLDKICLITDSMKASGLGDGTYSVGNLEVVVKEGEARLKESGALAGSVLTLNQAVRNMLKWTGVSVSEAVSMASLNSARVLGLEETLGSIEAGKEASLAVFDEGFNPVATILRGRFVHRKP